MSNSEDAQGDTEFLDLGCLLVPLLDDLEVQVDVDSTSHEIVSISLVLPHSIAAIQVFAAATNEEVWPQVRDGITRGLAEQHIETKVVLGRFGTEVHCVMPTQDEHGVTTAQAVRFVGIDGPRWFLRATIGGDAALFPKASTAMDDLLEMLEVVRGEHAAPTGERLTFVMPA